MNKLDREERKSKAATASVLGSALAGLLTLVMAVTKKTTEISSKRSFSESNLKSYEDSWVKRVVDKKGYKSAQEDYDKYHK